MVTVPVLIILMGLGYSTLWLFGARQAEEAARIWIAAQTKAGWVASIDGLRATGFPGRIALEGSKIRLAPPPDKSTVPWRWEAEGLRVHALPWSLRKPTIEPLGANTVTLPTGEDGEMVAHTVTTGTARLDLALDRQGQIVGFTVDATDIKATPPRAPKGNKDALTLESALISLSPQEHSSKLLDLRESSYTLAVNLRGLNVPASLEPPLGRRGEVLEATARILGPVTLNPSEPFIETIKRWRDDGGTMEMDRFYLHWAPLEMSAAGSLALDQSLQPVAALNARFQGFFASVNRLEEVGVMRAREASVARVVLGLMAERNPSGGAPLLSVPMTIQDRQVRVGPVTVMTFSGIQWGGRPPPSGQEIRPGFEVDRWGNVIRKE